MQTGRQIGVCSWSLEARSPAELIERVRAAGLSACQLALDPLAAGAWSLTDLRRRLETAGVRLLSGMLGCVGEDYTSLHTIRLTGGVRPDRHWPANLERAQAVARLAQELGLPLVTFHAGFLPHRATDDPQTQAERRVLLARLRQLADVFAACRVDLAFETGQESAHTLLEVLEDLERPRVGINFDPANMLLYDMGDPVAALELLAPRVRQVHIKDARRTEVPGTWGQEVPVGSGQVRWGEFFDVLFRRGLAVDLVIEREAGNQRIADVRQAHALVQSELARRVPGASR
jgi:sugar phosphate isomerase/epimerase